MFHKFSNKKQEKGQGLVEYAIILALIAIVVIVVISTVGYEINNTFIDIAWVISGNDLQDLHDAADALCAGKPSGTKLPGIGEWVGTNYYCL